MRTQQQRKQDKVERSNRKQSLHHDEEQKRVEEENEQTQVRSKRMKYVMRRTLVDTGARRSAITEEVTTETAAILLTTSFPGTLSISQLIVLLIQFYLHVCLLGIQFARS